MPVRKTSAETVKSSLWSGGATTEYFIYPPEASYAARDFEVRISMAQVDESPSTFTALAGFHRLLMPLSAPLRLVFAKAEEVSLQPLETTSFDGGIETVSHGVCTDFGIMHTDKWVAQLVALPDGTYPLGSKFSFVYAVNDGGTISWDTEEESGSQALKKGDFILFEDIYSGEIQITGLGQEMVVAGRIVAAQ